MAEYVKYASGFIEHLMNIGVIEKRNVIIEGQHPRLQEFANWYKGLNYWHIYKGTRNGEVVWKERQSAQLGKMMMEEIANNFANEHTQIVVPDKKQQNKLDNLLVGFFSSWGRFVERYQALGIGATIVMPKKIYHDNEGKIVRNDNEIIITKVDAKRVIPITVEGDEVTEVLIVRNTTSKLILQLHLKNEEGNYIIAEVEGDKESKMSSNVNFNYNNAKIIQVGDVPLFQIWTPNVADNLDDDIVIGVSRLGNAIPWLKLTDEIFTSLMTEFKNGKKKRFISAEMMHVDANGTKELILDDEEFVIPSDMNQSTLLQEFNGELRVESHVRALNTAMSGATKACGLGSGSFVFDSNGGGRPIQTATSQILKESDKYRTILKEEAQAQKNLKQMLMAIAYVNNNLVASDINLTYKLEDISITFDDNIVEDTESKKKLALQELQLGVLAQWEYRADYFDEDEETAKQFIFDNGLAMNAQNTNALVNNLDVPEHLIKLMHGEKYEYKQQLLDLMNATKLQASPMDYWDKDESDNDDNSNKETNNNGASDDNNTDNN